QDRSFLKEVQRLPETSQSPTADGRIVHVFERSLTPRTVYHWHAKARRRKGWDAKWSAPMAFETSAMQPRNVTPTHAASNVHPWKAKFTWDAVDGAKKYTVVVAEYDDFRSPRVADTVNEPISEKLVLHVDRQYFWSVFATG